MRVEMKQGVKKLGILMIMVLSMSVTAFASAPLHDLEEGVVDVYAPREIRVGLKSIVNDNYKNVGGGTLWTSWKEGEFRANYAHPTKEHRCTAENMNGDIGRSGWVAPGSTAISPWIPQSFIGNKVYYATR